MIGAFGQQLRWTTIEGKNNSIPYNKAQTEVLKLYDLYDYYYDETGYSKEAFLENFPENSEFLTGMEEIKENTMIAIRMHIDGGSAVMVMCIDEDNVHLVIFSNVNMANSNYTYNGDMTRDRKRFEKWFGSLLD